VVFVNVEGVDGVQVLQVHHLARKVTAAGTALVQLFVRCNSHHVCLNLCSVADAVNKVGVVNIVFLARKVGTARPAADLVLFLLFLDDFWSNGFRGGGGGGGHRAGLYPMIGLEVAKVKLLVDVCKVALSAVKVGIMDFWFQSSSHHSDDEVQCLEVVFKCIFGRESLFAGGTVVVGIIDIRFQIHVLVCAAMVDVVDFLLVQ